MATGWLKSLQCKSNVVNDVSRPPAFSLLHPTPKKKPKPKASYPSSCSSSSTTTVFSSSTSSCPAASTKKSSLLPLGCGNSPRFLKDVANLLPDHTTSSSDKPPRRRRRRHHARHQKDEQLKTNLSQQHHLQKPKPPPSPLHAAIPTPARPLFPTLTELPRGHSSRRVVELIFSSRWPRSPSDAPFSGSIEILFRIHQPARTAAAFEEYRDCVRSRAGPTDTRCAADGNETMRFHPATPSSSSSWTGGDHPLYDGTVRVLPATTGGGMKGGSIRTFSGSGRAHDEGGAGEGVVSGLRAMLVCRVIAGRIRAELGDGPDEYESISAGKGELLVFDPRAVLPCFLIIYKL